MLKTTVPEVSPSSPVHTWSNQIPLSYFTNSLLMVKAPISFFSEIEPYAFSFSKSCLIPQSFLRVFLALLSLACHFSSSTRPFLQPHLSLRAITLCPMIFIRPVCNCPPCLPSAILTFNVGLLSVCWTSTRVGDSV